MLMGHLLGSPNLGLGMGPEEMGRGSGEMLRGPQLSMKSCGNPTFPELGRRGEEVERLIIEGF